VSAATCARYEGWNNIFIDGKRISLRKRFDIWISGFSDAHFDLVSCLLTNALLQSSGRKTLNATGDIGRRNISGLAIRNWEMQDLVELL